MGDKIEKNWMMKTQAFNAYDSKSDVIQILIDLGIDSLNLVIESKSNLSFHPGRSGSFYLGSNKGPLLASFGEINPIIVNQLELDKLFTLWV